MKQHSPVRVHLDNNDDISGYHPRYIELTLSLAFTAKFSLLRMNQMNTKKRINKNTLCISLFFLCYFFLFYMLAGDTGDERKM